MVVVAEEVHATAVVEEDLKDTRAKDRLAMEEEAAVAAVEVVVLFTRPTYHRPPLEEEEVHATRAKDPLVVAAEVEEVVVVQATRDKDPSVLVEVEEEEEVEKEEEVEEEEEVVPATRVKCPSALEVVA